MLWVTVFISSILSISISKPKVTYKLIKVQSNTSISISNNSKQLINFQHQNSKQLIGTYRFPFPFTDSIFNRWEDTWEWVGERKGELEERRGRGCVSVRGVENGRVHEGKRAQVEKMKETWEVDPTLIAFVREKWTLPIVILNPSKLNPITV